MTLTRRIPKAAMGMVKIIREEVPRPDKLPRKHWGRFCFVRPGWALATSCPMGLIPGAQTLPTTPGDLPDRISIRPFGVRSFAKWWDEQEDAQAATDAVWPKKKSKVAKKK